jgi:hypothetical protein
MLLHNANNFLILIAKFLTLFGLEVRRKTLNGVRNAEKSKKYTRVVVESR